jgi:hypothetical protein
MQIRIQRRGRPQWHATRNAGKVYTKFSNPRVLLTPLRTHTHMLLCRMVPTKSAVCTAVTRMREHGNTAQGVFVDLYGAASPHTAAIDDYFRWYLAMSAGTANVRAQYQCFTTAANRVLRMHWKNKSKSRSSKLDWSDIGTDVSYLLPRD